MRVAIDARKLHDFGIGTYIRNLLRHLARIDATTDYVLLCAPADMHVPATLGPNFRAVLEPAPNYSLREQWHVPLVVVRANEAASRILPALAAGSPLSLALRAPEVLESVTQVLTGGGDADVVYGGRGPSDPIYEVRVRRLATGDGRSPAPSNMRWK